MKRTISAFAAIAIFMQLFFVIPAGAASVGGSYISSSGACVMDYDTGEVLYEYNGNVPRLIIHIFTYRHYRIK